MRIINSGAEATPTAETRTLKPSSNIRRRVVMQRSQPVVRIEGPKVPTKPSEEYSLKVQDRILLHNATSALAEFRVCDTILALLPLAHDSQVPTGRGAAR